MPYNLTKEQRPMAKAKKQSSEGTPAAATNPTAKKVGKKAAEPAAKPAQPLAPMIDTNLAAATAAKFVARKEDLGASPAPSHGESTAFKQMKENLHKPVGGSTPSFLQNIVPAKKFNNSIPGKNQQLGRNQTFGADVNRTGVPRRTGGG
jgi:hypothetical protein